MIVVYQGLESSTHRETLLSALPGLSRDGAMGSISFRSLRSRRLGAAYVRETAKDIPLILESGAAKASLTKEQATDLADEYYRFLAEVPEIRHAVAFDHPSLADTITPKQADPRIVRILHDLEDEDGLKSLIEMYGDVAMAYDGHRSRIAAILHEREDEDRLYLARSHTGLEEARREGFTAVATNAWLAPGRYGEMSLWDGGKFHRVNSKGREDLLKRYGTRVESYGFDLDLLHDGDTREMQRLAAHSLMQWSRALVSDTTPGTESSGSEKGVAVSTASPLPTRARPRGSIDLPGFSSEEITGVEENEDGTTVIRSRATVRPSGEAVRVCDSCFLRTNCPAFEAGSGCAFKFPVEVRTDTQMKALLSGMVEMQATRVAFARFAEEVNGGYPDPTVGEELDRLVRVTERMQRLADKREKLTVSLESESSGGGTGVLSRIFGERPKQTVPEIIQADVSDA